MYSKRKGGKSVGSEKFIKTLKNKIYDILNKYNNTYHRTIKIKPADAKPNIYIDFNKENIKKGI